MRLHKIVTRTLLILFIVVDFVFGAPVAAREKLEGGIDVDVTEDGTAALQKRVNPVDELSMNMADQTPSSPDWTVVEQLWQEVKKQGMFIDSPTPLKFPGWDTPPFSEGSSAESTVSNARTPSPEGSPPGSIVSNLLPPSLPMPLPKGRLPPTLSLATDTLSTTGHQSTLKQRPGPDLDVHPQNPEPRPLSNLVQPPPKLEPHPPAAAEMPMDEFLDMLMNGQTKPPNPVQPPPNPGPHPPAAAEMPTNESLDVLVKGKKRKRPKLMQPLPDPGLRPLPNPVQPPLNPESHPPVADEMPIDEYLDMLMTGKIKRTFLAPVL